MFQKVVRGEEEKQMGKRNRGHISFCLYSHSDYFVGRHNLCTSMQMIMQMSLFPRVKRISFSHSRNEWGHSRKAVTHCFRIETPPGLESPLPRLTPFHQLPLRPWRAEQVPARRPVKKERGRLRNANPCGVTLAALLGRGVS